MQRVSAELKQGASFPWGEQRVHGVELYIQAEFATPQQPVDATQPECGLHTKLRFQYQQQGGRGTVSAA